jgi:hypothetical protein
MKQFINRLPRWLIPVATTLLGLIIGVALLVGLLLVEQRGRWERFDLPPGEIVSLAAADENQVVVLTADGLFYEVYCRAKAPEDICWEQVEPPEEFSPLPCDDAETLLPPPGLVRDQVDFCMRHEFLDLNRYALLEDGTLWRWHVFIYPLGQVARLFQAAVLGTLGGAVIGIVIVVMKN